APVVAALPGTGMGRPRLVLDRGIEAPAQAALHHQRLDHVTSHLGTPEHSYHPGRTSRTSAAAADRHHHQISGPGFPDAPARTAATVRVQTRIHGQPPASLEERLGDREAPL